MPEPKALSAPARAEGRIVEVEWEDTLTRHGWSSSDELPTQAWLIHSVGYVTQDDKAGLVVVEARGESASGVGKDYGCATFIPRSAIRKVTELSRRRRELTRKR